MRNMKIFKRKVKAVGGIYFLSIAMIMCFIFLIVVNLSFSSSAVSISENIAHIVCTKVAIYSYQSNTGDYDKWGSNINIEKPNGIFNPIEDFKSICKDFDIIQSYPTTCRVTWNSSTRIATLTFGEFTIKSGNKIKVRTQEAIIEDS